ADFTDADLRNADLREASLRGAILAGANLVGADATGADLRGAKIKRTMLGPSTKGVAEAVASAHSERTGAHPARVPVPSGQPRRDDPDLSWSR
ncbi:MAG: pentapeptide repeat-containing protein, partial [Bryobacterales bacterium]|nr:pentapeptide repeat-containing protein [Bryobacterales bacterium]